MVVDEALPAGGAQFILEAATLAVGAIVMIASAGLSVSGRNMSARGIVPSMVGISTSKLIRMPSFRGNNLWHVLFSVTRVRLKPRPP